MLSVGNVAYAERGLTASDVISCSDFFSASGYLSLVVKPSRIQTIFPSTTAGSASESTVSQGATFCTRSRGERS